MSDERITKKLVTPAPPEATDVDAAQDMSEATNHDKPPSFDPFEHQNVTVPPGFRVEMLQKKLPELEDKYRNDTSPPRQPKAVAPDSGDHPVNPLTVLSAHGNNERDSSKVWFAFALGAIFAAGFLAFAFLSSQRNNPASATPASATTATSPQQPAPPASQAPAPTSTAEPARQAAPVAPPSALAPSPAPLRKNSAPAPVTGHNPPRTAARPTPSSTTAKPAPDRATPLFND